MKIEDTNTVGLPADKIQAHVFACHDEIRRLRDSLWGLLSQVEQGAEFHAITFRSPTTKEAIRQAKEALSS